MNETRLINRLRRLTAFGLTIESYSEIRAMANLHRVGLTKAERDEHIREYARLLGERDRDQRESEKVFGHFEQKPVSRGGRPRTDLSEEIAATTGLSKSTIRRALNPTPAPMAADPPTHDDRKAQQRDRFWKMWAALDDDVRRQSRPACEPAKAGHPAPIC